MVILKTLEQKGKVTMDVLVGKMGVSSKTVQNDIKAINVAMKQWAVIDCRHGMYKLYITDEGQYRRVRNDIEKQNACFESPQMRMSFIVDTLMNSDQPYLIDELAYAIEANLHITLPTNERLFLTIPFVGMRTPYDISGIENHVVVSGEVLELVDIIFAQIRQETGLGIKIQDEGALEEFIYHLYFMTNRMRYGFKLHNPMVKSMKEKFGVAYRMAEPMKSSSMSTN